MDSSLSVARRKRIQRLKKILISSFLVLIFVPIIFCIVIFLQMKNLEKQLEKLTEVVAQQRQDIEAKMEDPASDVIINELKNEVQLEEGQQEESSENDLYQKIYLTFDDGPSQNTSRILDILDEYEVKATFFVIGKTDKESLELYKRIVEEGHTIGLHSYTHDYAEIYASVDAYAEDLKRIQELVYETTGVWSHYARFPGGSSNKVSKVDMLDCIAYLKGQEIEYFDWNVSITDIAHGATSVDAMAQNVVRDLGKHHEAIVLMHDSADKDTTVEALPKIIESILEMENTKILPIDDETVPVQHIKMKQE